MKASVSEIDGFDIGQFVSKAVIDDDTKVNLINSDWKPTSDF